MDLAATVEYARAEIHQSAASTSRPITTTASAAVRSVTMDQHAQVVVVRAAQLQQCLSTSLVILITAVLVVRFAGMDLFALPVYARAASRLPVQSISTLISTTVEHAAINVTLDRLVREGLANALTEIRLPEFSRT